MDVPDALDGPVGVGQHSDLDRFIDQAASTLHPHRPIPQAELARQRARIAQHGESTAAWNTDVLSGLLAGR